MNEIKKLTNKGYCLEYLDFAYSPYIHSGSDFDLSPNKEPDSNKL